MPGAGSRAFASRCGMCHGIDGRGGEHAPDITSGAVAELPDADLERILQNGIPARGMPAFGVLGPAFIKSMVAYLRVLQGRVEKAAVNGNPARGRELFFGQAQCSDCHMVRGAGGFLGPDLSSYSRSHSPDRVRQAIVDTDRHSDVKAGMVKVVTRDGRELVGLARNEDNFSLQLQTLDGSFHLLMKSELLSLSHEHHSLMPSDYASRLSARDLDDLVSFLVSVGAGQSNEGSKPGWHG
ncbi:MAG TPA: c-type cytochrome [Terriglobia bacterium]|nr:c-type cytochrome [Terriglobia bacterium]